MNADIPVNLKKLSTIEDKESFEYQDLAFKAASDVLSSGREALSSFDSARALKLLSIGAKLLPWRNDVVSLRNNALETYIKITNEYIDNGDCDLIRTRIVFLNTVAPDGYLKIKKIPKNCDQKLSKAPAPSLDDLFNLPEPKRDSSIEIRNFTDLPSQANYYIEQNNRFPEVELLLMSFQHFYDFWNGFSIICKNFSIDPNITNSKNIVVESSCDLSQEFTYTSDDVILDRFKKDVEKTNKLLYVLGGDSYKYIFSSFLGKFRTETKITSTVPRINKFKDIQLFLQVNNPAVVFDIYVENHKGLQHLKQFVGQLSARTYTHRLHKIEISLKMESLVRKLFGVSSALMLKGRSTNRLDYLYPNSSSVKQTFYFNNIEDTKNLKQVIIRPNFNDTYKLYKEWHKLNWSIDMLRDKSKISKPIPKDKSDKMWEFRELGIGDLWLREKEYSWIHSMVK